KVIRPVGRHRVGIHPLRTVSGSITAHFGIRPCEIRRINPEVPPGCTDGYAGKWRFADPCCGKTITDGGVAQFQVSTVLNDRLIDQVQPLVVILCLYFHCVWLIVYSADTGNDPRFPIFGYLWCSIENAVAIIRVED